MSWGVGAIRIFHSEGFPILRLLIKNVTTLLSRASQLSLGCEWLFLQCSFFIHTICMNPWKKMVPNSIQAILYENPLSKSTSPAVLCQHCLIHNSQMEQWGAIPFLLFVMILPLHFPFYFSNNMHDIIYSYSTVFWWLCSLRLLFKPTGMLVPYHDGINTSGFWITYHYSVHILNVED